MRSRILPAVGISAVALVAATALAPMAGAHSAPNGAGSAKAATVKAAAVAKKKTCATQGSTPDGFGISSQDFESSFDIYDDMAADDFKVAKTCKIKTVVVSGFYSAGTSSTTKANVTFYKNKKGKPGAVVKAKNGAKVTDDGVGNFTIKLGGKVKLKKGTYWVSVQAVLDFSTGGQWYWAQSTDGSGKPAQWENPGGGFGVCPTWDSVVTCNGATDTAMIFTLK